MKKYLITVLAGLLVAGTVFATQLGEFSGNSGLDPYAYLGIYSTSKYPGYVGGATYFGKKASGNYDVFGAVGATNRYHSDTDNGILNFQVKKNGVLSTEAWVDPTGLVANNATVKNELKVQKITTTQFGGPAGYQPVFGGQILFSEEGAPVATTPFGQRANIMMFNHTADTEIGSALYIVSKTETSTGGPVAKNAITLHCEHLPDNGYDSGCLSAFQAGGANAITAYSLPWGFGGNTLTGHAVEAAVDNGGAVYFGAAGANFTNNPSPNHSAVLWGRIDNPYSFGVLIEPWDTQFDSRMAFGVGTKTLNQDPTNLKFQVNLNGLVKTQNDVYVTDTTKGIILTRPDGQCARGTLNNLNNLVFNTIICP